MCVRIYYINFENVEIIEIFSKDLLYNFEIFEHFENLRFLKKLTSIFFTSIGKYLWIQFQGQNITYIHIKHINIYNVSLKEIYNDPISQICVLFPRVPFLQKLNNTILRFLKFTCYMFIHLFITKFEIFENLTSIFFLLQYVNICGYNFKDKILQNITKILHIYILNK